MKWLIDTNVISEIGKPAPNNDVIKWFENQKQEAMLISVVSIAEIRYGLETLADAEKRRRFSVWLEDVVRPLFSGRILGISEDILLIWRALAQEAKKQNQTIPQADSLIAATARHGGFAICTRDVKPFHICGVPTFNPFTGERFNGA
jgi:toxin FitB